jgi:hypothetical protein
MVERTDAGGTITSSMTWRITDSSELKSTKEDDIQIIMTIKVTVSSEQGKWLPC